MTYIGESWMYSLYEYVLYSNRGQGTGEIKVFRGVLVHGVWGGWLITELFSKKLR